MSDHSRYSMLIEWSDLDDAYVVSFPEWERDGHLAHTHGATYAEAAQKGQEMLAFLMDSAKEDQESVPVPAIFDAHAYQPGETADDIARQTQQMLAEMDTSQDTERGTPHVSART